MRCGILFLTIVTTWLSCVVQAEDLLDIRSIAADLVVPSLEKQPAAAGVRVKQTLSSWSETKVYHVLYLPKDWRDDGTRYPVLVEWAGNGGYRSAYGDVSTGRPEGSCLGYGLSAGSNCIWLCLPYLNGSGDELSLQWWGDRPNYEVRPTLDYCHAAISEVCRQYGGDERKLVLCGFSRGAIACNYLGLHNDDIARLWRGFFAFSHYDGMRPWPFPNSDRTSALERLKRLDGRPQFICSEGRNSAAVRDYLEPLVPTANLTIMDTGFRNHSDAWILRPSPARTAARDWLKATIQEQE